MRRRAYARIPGTLVPVITTCPDDLCDLVAEDGSVDLALNEPGYGPRVRRKQAWWGDEDDELVIGRHLQTFVDAHDGWHVLHSVYIPSLDTDVDAIVCGPAGVIVVQAAYTPSARVCVVGDTLIVDGRCVSSIVGTRALAARTQQTLHRLLGGTVPVSALVVPVGAAQIDIALISDGVAVVEPSALTWWLNQLPPSTWSNHHAAMVFDLARRSSTWEAA